MRGCGWCVVGVLQMRGLVEEGEESRGGVIDVMSVDVRV